MLRVLKNVVLAASARRHARLVLVAAVLVLSATAAALLASSSGPSSTRQLVNRQPAAPSGSVSASFKAVRAEARKAGRHVVVGHSVRNHTSLPLRDIRPVHVRHHQDPESALRSLGSARQPSRAAVTGGIVQRTPAAKKVPSPSQTFEGIDFPGVACNCLPPDTDGEVGQTQYVQVVNDGFQVFSKTGTTVLGPVDIATIWSGLGGNCEINGDGDPIVLYDQLANRWVVSQFAGATIPTDECIAVSATNDATGAWHQYDFNLGSNFFDYPHIGVWPDAYYMSDIVFNSAGTAYLGPQPFAFNRAAMLAGSPATFITVPTTPSSASEDPYLPADLDGSTPPPSGAADPFVEWPGNGTYRVYRFHVNFASPGSSTFTLAGAPAASAFSVLCGGTRNCVPQPGTAQGLDAIGDRFMFRAAYRNFGDHESLVSNYTVSSGGVAGIRWFELRNVTSGSPARAQESTYQPDSTYRWMGSAAMDQAGNLALGFSASSAAAFPSIGYAARLSTDPANQLSQGETTMVAGGGSQLHTPQSRWGDYSAMSVDPTDDCTFWYTNEYYSTSSDHNWQTRIGSFKLPDCPKVTVQCVVPKVTGLTLKKAKPKIVAAHCKVGKITKKHSTKKKRGKVIKQSPSAGKHLVAGSKVKLIVGK